MSGEDLCEYKDLMAEVKQQSQASLATQCCLSLAVCKTVRLTTESS